MNYVRHAAILLLLLTLIPENGRGQDELRINLGGEVNSAASELQPIITPDGEVLYFTRKGDTANLGYATRSDDEDIWYSVRRPDGGWSRAMQFDTTFNSTGYDGVRAVNLSGTRLYLQGSYRPDGGRSRGYSVSQRRDDGRWERPVALDIKNYYNDTTVATMSISADESVLILSAKRHDSKGGHDLYISRRTGPYSFSEPELIDALSTLGDEIAPFIAFDDRTIYFPSTGFGASHERHDIFMARRLDSTWLSWSRPIALPAPINTASDDFYINLTAHGDTVYLSSWHQTSTRGFGRSDIWKVMMPPAFRPGAMPQAGSVDSSEGGLTVGRLFRLEGVYFDVNAATLRPESRTTLDELVVTMSANPTMKINVQGHTDSDGTDSDNMTLSDNRANAVRNYLIDHGIAPGRLVATGYGESQPIAPNSTRTGKQLNRRVMVEILGFDFAG